MKMTRKADPVTVEGEVEVMRNTMSGQGIRGSNALIIHGREARVDLIGPAGVSEAIMDNQAIATAVDLEEMVVVAVWTNHEADGQEVSRDKVDMDSRIRIGDQADHKVDGTADPRDMETAIWVTRVDMVSTTRADGADLTRDLAVHNRIMVPRVMDLLPEDMINRRDTETRVAGADHLIQTRGTVAHRAIMVLPRDMETRVAGVDHLTRVMVAREDSVDQRAAMADHNKTLVVQEVMEAHRADTITRVAGADLPTRVIVDPRVVTEVLIAVSVVHREDSADQKVVTVDRRNLDIWDTMVTRGVVPLTGEVMTRTAADLMVTTAACNASIQKAT